ncbi:MAG: M23 family metallopeptidase [Clostridia bacterium]|nr:M23 family metallopeptidase [Clostridia bacterium]
MNEELSYAEMLEIPVETVTVNRREKKRKTREENLSDQLIGEINTRLESADPAYAESKAIEREVREAPKAKLARRILLGEFIAVCALCAAIFLTNLFITNSAINTFVRGLFQGNASTADARTYADFTLSPIVNDTVDAEIAVSDMGVMSFTAEGSIYAPAAGKLESVSGNAESGYSIRIRHSDSFSTIISGLDDVYKAAGDTVRTNIPFAWTDGDGEVRVMFYQNDTILNCYTVSEGAIAWS